MLPALPERAIVVLASRTAPEADWHQSGWENVTVDMPLAPLSHADAVTLLHQRGLQSEATVADIVGWADGAPLALVLAGDVAANDPSWSVDRVAERPDVVRTLLQRIGQTELDGGNLDVAAVAALSRSTTRGLLRDVLPDVDAEAAEAWLRSLSFSDVSGPGVTLHDLARVALRADLRLRAPERERELRRRIADHLYTRALAGNPWLITDLADLVDNPALRWGFGAEGSVDYRVDEPRAGDVEAIADRMIARATTAWWDATKILFERMPERCVVARDRDDEIAGFCIAVTPDNAPAAADEDAVLGDWLRHAREHVQDGNALLWSDSIDLTSEVGGDPSSPVLSLLNTAAFLRSGLTSPRYLYLPIDPDNAPAVAFSKGVGAVHIPELDIVLKGKAQQCHVFDTGDGGLVASLRAAVYAELGLVPDAGPRQQGRRVDDQTPTVTVTADTIKDVLRNLHRPLELADSPLAQGGSPEERAASVRRLVEDAVQRAFGASADEELLRSIVRRGYLDPAASHESVAEDLYLSRATYFRRLRQASNRVAAWILARQED